MPLVLNMRLLPLIIMGQMQVKKLSVSSPAGAPVAVIVIVIAAFIWSAVDECSQQRDR